MASPYVRLSPSHAPVRRRRRCAARGARSAGTRAFSLVELTIVVLIISILAAIAVRRLSRHSEQAATNAVAQDTSALQTAVEAYRAEHGAYPAADKIVDQLTKYTDVFGNVSATRATPYIYGPYLRNIPPLPVGSARGSQNIAAAAGVDVGWVYDPTTGAITANDAP
jgi:prepilin-type N-terminal cleavage/methylation domain-containing protein